MRYNVAWGPRAEAMLAAIWLAAQDRAAVTRSASRLDAQLASDPLHLGESRTSSVHRIAFDSPLGVEFEIVEDDKLVIVQGVFAVS